jgi:hypothetical protein
LIARNVRLQILVTDVDRARGLVDQEVANRQGVIARLEVGGDRASGRTLSATVKIPAASLGEVLAIFRQLGRVQSERQSSEDVTAQSVDLDARLTNARRTEQRMTAVLANRTGRITDVLEVERELARVRGEIEQMEAERAQLAGRVAMAAIDLSISEARLAAATPDTPSAGQYLANAFRDGLRNSLELCLAMLSFVLQVAPSALLIVTVAGLPMLLWRRSRRPHLQ